jgi:tripartite-type tricarboxylate transporter receptor subunit TctC
VDCYFGSGTLLSYVRSCKVRALATTGPERDPAALDLPTIAEAGVPGYEVVAWQALFVPAKTPPEIVRKMSADTKVALADPAIKAKLARSGYVAGASSPEELENLLKSEIEQNGAPSSSRSVSKLISLGVLIGARSYCPLWVKSRHLRRKSHVRFTPESGRVRRN